MTCQKLKIRATKPQQNYYIPSPGVLLLRFYTLTIPVSHTHMLMVKYLSSKAQGKFTECSVLSWSLFSMSRVLTISYLAPYDVFFL